MRTDTWKSTRRGRRSPVFIWRRSASAGNRHVHGGGGITDSHVWAVRGMFDFRRGAGTFCDERSSGIWSIYAGCDIQSFWKCRKRIPVSSGVCFSASFICQLDGNRKRSLSCGKTKKSCQDHGSDRWKDRGLWIKRFPEYGGMYGAGSSRYHPDEFKGFWKKSHQLRQDHHRRSGLYRSEHFAGSDAEKRTAAKRPPSGLWNENLRPEYAGYPCRGERMRLCSSDAVSLYSPQDPERGMETGTLCAHRSADVYGQL